MEKPFKHSPLKLASQQIFGQSQTSKHATVTSTVISASCFHHWWPVRPKIPLKVQENYCSKTLCIIIVLQINFNFIIRIKLQDSLLIDLKLN